MGLDLDLGCVERCGYGMEVENRFEPIRLIPKSSFGMTDGVGQYMVAVSAFDILASVIMESWGWLHETTPEEWEIGSNFYF